MLKNKMDKQKIVLVEDDKTYQDQVRSWVSPRYDILCLNTGHDLIDDVKQYDPDAVILGIDIKNKNASQLCHKIRASSSFTHLPVMFLSSSTDEDDDLAYLQAGGDAYLDKSMDKKTLISKLRELMTYSSVF